jgi:hypothetical protein
MHQIRCIDEPVSATRPAIVHRRTTYNSVCGNWRVRDFWALAHMFWENWTSTQPAASRPSSIAPAPNGVHLCSGRTHGPHTERPQSPTARRGVSAGLSLIDSLSKKGISSLLVLYLSSSLIFIPEPQNRVQPVPQLTKTGQTRSLGGFNSGFG